MNRLRTYARFVKIEHSVFALPVIVGGALLVAGRLPLPITLVLQVFSHTLGWIMVSAIGARIIGFAFNRIIDRKIDQLNPRTKMRELPARSMSMVEAGFVLLIGFAFYLLGAIRISFLCVLLSPIPLIVFLIYPFMKRFTCLAHFGVGLALALGPLAAGIAVGTTMFMNRLATFSADSINVWMIQHMKDVTSMFLKTTDLMPVIVLAIFTFFWVSGFDIIYSTLDEEFDRAQGLYSLPAKLGRRKALWVSAVLHGLAFVTLGWLYVSYFRSPVAGGLFGATGVLLFLEQYLAEHVDLAFFKINGIISFLVLAFIWTGVAHL